ncbi:MAG: TonB C-terminal domain-containing protein [Desulfobacterales bacterium]|nr:TonB C-terminal domain-containing protein [Desulfobacterales bacterium]
MREVTYEHIYLFSQAPDMRSWSATSVLSAICHIALFALCFFINNYWQSSSNNILPGVIDVTLISMPGSPGGKTPVKPEPKSELPVEKPMDKPKIEEPKTVEQPKQPEVKKTEPVIIEKPKVQPEHKKLPTPPPDAVSLAPKKEPPKPPVKDVQEKTQPKDDSLDKKALDDAIAKLQKKVTGSRPQALNNAIAKLKRQVSETGEGEGEGTGGIGNGSGGGRLADRMDLYKLQIAYEIQKNWAFSEHIAGSSSELEVRIVIKIMPDGKIGDVWFDKKSGNTYLDDSAYRAVMKSILPSLPEEYTKQFLNLGLSFTPSGLK